MDRGPGRGRGIRGRRGRRGGQIGDRKNQMEKHETAGHAELEKEIVTVTQQFEDVSTFTVGVASDQVGSPSDGKSEAIAGSVRKRLPADSEQRQKDQTLQRLQTTDTTDSNDIELAKRPVPGTQGHQIALRSNFYEVEDIPDQVFHYVITISDGRTDDNFSEDLRLQIIEELVSLNPIIFEKRPVYDAQKSVYSILKLPFESKAFTVTVMDNGRLKEFKVNLQFVAKIEMRALHQTVEGRQRLQSQESITVLDLILRYSASLNLKVLGSRFITSDGATDIGMGCKIRQGYNQGVRQGWKRRSESLSNDDFMESFNVTVGNALLEVPGRILNTPDIIYGEGEPLNPSSGAWNMKDQILYRGAAIGSWGLVVYGGFPRNKIDHFKTCLWRAAGKIGIALGECHFQRLADEKQIASRLVTEALIKAPKLQLLVVILPGKTPLYADLKRICETENGHLEIGDHQAREILKQNGLSTQCIHARNAILCKEMTLAQLCLKINSKMGGANNSIASNNITRPPRIFQEPVIILGADVTHPGPRDKSKPSIAAVVASIDNIPSRYAAAVRIMEKDMETNKRKEIIEDLCSITKEMLRAFYRRLKVKPKKIIMFRHGVSEGQFQKVLFHEMCAIQKACLELEENYQPAITFIVVTKRHHGRFIVVSPRDGDRKGNCQPGTTIDQEVCHPTMFDYYQFSHAAIQGTSRPTKYHVLWDDSNFTSDEIQALSFMLCHLYARCTRSVSLPAPAYYADLLATRAACYLTRDSRGDATSVGSTGGDDLDQARILNLQEIIKPHPNLANRMYFV